MIKWRYSLWRYFIFNYIKIKIKVPFHLGTFVTWIETTSKNLLSIIENLRILVLFLFIDRLFKSIIDTLVFFYCPLIFFEGLFPIVIRRNILACYFVFQISKDNSIRYWMGLFILVKKSFAVIVSNAFFIVDLIGIKSWSCHE